MSDLLELADRCEKATGPDRAKDGEIFMALGLDRPYRGTLQVINMPVSHTITDGMTMHDAIAGGCPEHHAAIYYAAPTYTASLDAALTLVPEGWEWGCGRKDATGRPWAWVGQPIAGRADWEPMNPANAATPALALTAASLRAINSIRRTA